VDRATLRRMVKRADGIGGRLIVIGRVGEVGAWFVFVRRFGMVVVKVCVV
jgi:hypothetical protein